MEKNKEMLKIELDRIGRTYSAIFGSLIGFFLSVTLASLFGKVNQSNTILCFLCTLWLLFVIYLIFKYRYEMLEEKQ